MGKKLAVEVRFDSQDPHAREDRAWFSDHPERTMRLRPYIPGEWHRNDMIVPPGHLPYTLVLLIGRGKRWRLPVLVESVVMRDDEEALRTVFNHMTGREWKSHAEAHAFWMKHGGFHV